MLPSDQQYTLLFRPEAMKYRSREALGHPLVTTTGSLKLLVAITMMMLTTTVAVGIALRVWSE